MNKKSVLAFMLSVSCALSVCSLGSAAFAESGTADSMQGSSAAVQLMQPLSALAQASGTPYVPDPGSDFSTSAYEVPGEFGPADEGPVAVEKGALSGYSYLNYPYGYSITDERGNTVYTRGGENISVDADGNITVTYIDAGTMVSSHMTYVDTQLKSRYPAESWDALRAQIESFLKNDVSTDFGEGFFNIGIGQNTTPNCFNMTGLRFRYGESFTGNFTSYSPRDYNQLSVNNAFLAVVSNETDGKETDSGYSVYLLRGQFYEEYVKQTAAGHPMGSVVSNDNQVIELDGKQYVGQLFSGGFMYIDGGNLVVDTEHYYDTETKQPVRGGIENYVVAPSWFESQTLTGHFVDKEDENIHYFNFGDTCVAVGTVNGDQYEYEYFARRIYNESTNELEIVRYERDELIYMGRQSVLWNGEASLNAIKNAYPQMDQNTTLEQFEKDVQDAMWAAYNRYIDQGFSLGRSSGEGIMLWGNAIKLGFQGTDSDGEYIDNYEKCFLLYNPIQKYAYAFYGPPISACYGLNNTGGVDNITQMGAPIDEMQYISEGIYADSWYQNFTTGYIFVEKSFPDTVQFVEGGVFDGTVPVDEEKNAEALLQKEEREKAQSGGCGGTLGSLGSLLALAPVAAAVGFIRNRKGGV